MKKIFLISAMTLTIATATFAHGSMDRSARKERRIERKEERKEHRLIRKAENRNMVSDFTREQFRRDFPGAKKVLFQKTKEFEEASFTLEGKQKIAYYDVESNLIGTTQHKTFGALPERAQKKILNEYAGYAVQDVVKFDDNMSNETDMVLYGTAFDDADNYFVELKKDSKVIFVKVDMEGDVSYFTAVR
jgi:hypothetical protein